MKPQPIKNKNPPTINTTTQSYKGRKKIKKRKRTTERGKKSVT